MGWGCARVVGVRGWGGVREWGGVRGWGGFAWMRAAPMGSHGAAGRRRPVDTPVDFRVHSTTEPKPRLGANDHRDQAGRRTSRKSRPTTPTTPTLGPNGYRDQKTGPCSHSQVDGRAGSPGQQRQRHQQPMESRRQRRRLGRGARNPPRAPLPRGPRPEVPRTGPQIGDGQRPTRNSGLTTNLELGQQQTRNSGSTTDSEFGVDDRLGIHPPAA